MKDYDQTPYSYMPNRNIVLIGPIYHIYLRFDLYNFYLTNKTIKASRSTLIGDLPESRKNQLEIFCLGML